MSVYIVLFKSRGFISRLIQFQTRSPYSHVGVMVRGTLYEAYHKGGVQKRRVIPLDEVELYGLALEVDEDELLQWLESKIGLGYDWVSVFRFLTRRPADYNSRYYCAEFVLDAFKAQGLTLLRAESHNVSPRDCAMIPFLRETMGVWPS